jgi:hypothetical protein
VHNKDADRIIWSQARDEEATVGQLEKDVLRFMPIFARHKETCGVQVYVKINLHLKIFVKIQLIQVSNLRPHDMLNMSLNCKLSL